MIGKSETKLETTLMTTCYRLTAEHADNGEVRELARSTKLEKLVKRLLKDGEMWDRLGWEGIMLEDSTSGFYSSMSAEHLRGMLKRGEITYDTFKELRHFAD